MFNVGVCVCVFIIFVKIHPPGFIRYSYIIRIDKTKEASMKNWADHCSSDEESLTEEVAAELEKVQVEDEVQQEEEQIVEEAEPVDHVQPEVQEPPPPVEKTYNFPSQPPFTAFIGNLAYSVDDGEKLKEALGDVIADRLGPGKVNVLNGRIATDRQSGRHRGFGYVEVETVDQVSLTWNLICKRFEQFLANSIPDHAFGLCS